MTTEIVTYGLNDAQRVILNQATPKDAIKYRQGRGGQQLAYVTHAWVNGLLNDAFGHRWSWEVLDTLIVPDTANPLEAIVKGRLIVYLPDGSQIVKEQFGACDVKRTKDGKLLSLGDDLKAASSDALKKAASLLGVALDLYGPRYDDDNGLTGEPEPKGKVIDGKATTSAQQAPQPPQAPANGKSRTVQPRRAVPQNGAASTGNGHKPAAPTRPKWASPQEAQAWAMSLGAFEHERHAANAYDKLRRAAVASENPPKNAAEFFDMWHTDVLRRLAEKHAELDTAAAGDEQPLS